MIRIIRHRRTAFAGDGVVAGEQYAVFAQQFTAFQRGDGAGKGHAAVLEAQLQHLGRGTDTAVFADDDLAARLAAYRVGDEMTVQLVQAGGSAVTRTASETPFLV